MTNHSWVDEFPGAVTVCDPEGIILEMNQKSAENFKDDGGMELIGKNMFDCHPRTRTNQNQRAPREKAAPTFILTEKKGVHKLIYQSPWYKNGKYCGFVELSLVIPSEIPRPISFVILEACYRKHRINSNT